ncbi:phospholipase D-like domain-containing protein [Thermocoleostomius sinensis]|uniref:Phosphatidylserine/phosphatidylglycerophosphate/ cardiolipin synthase family protein n=1 Tax=Thermocoleostomius sinensis A174 TaxID=2016057 RepID=A0A9E8Z7U8_9CYAN|nr:phosphatidylserine/phosphatidylglycerophosphate/cardiolipin synthase family protein [Thermocoleostomius sinensis]WAL58078.1 phosphatidylserine/phosphatidylglycerophosphate/cardiolipin synthase family protein [Thermocoleostomius sinensis A174]
MSKRGRGSKQQPRTPWLKWLGAGLIMLLLVPLGLLYLRGAFRQSVTYSLANVPSLEDDRFVRMVMGLSSSLPTNGELIGFWIGADAIYAARLEAIRQAQRSIQFETYYMTPGQRADEFAAALIEQATNGVTVQLLVDNHGTGSIPDDYWQRLTNAGAEVRFFREFDWRAPLDYNSRTHRKLLVIDGQQVLIGGAGVSDDWDGDPDIGDVAPWLEFEVGYTGPIASLMEGFFLQNWAYDGGRVDLAQAMPIQSDADVPLYITYNAASLDESAIRMLFQLSFMAAADRIWIGSPYFVPDTPTRDTLIDAKERGVDVRVLTMGESNDKPIVRFASRELYGPLLAAGVEICEYQPSMMHAKLALIDSGWASTGSANFDPRSYFHNDELNVSTTYPPLIQHLDRFFVSALEDSHCLTYSEWQSRSWTEIVQGRFGLLFKDLL